MKHIFWCCVVLFLAVSLVAQTTPTKKSKAAQIEAELEQLREDRATDRKQIETLQQEVALLKQEMQRLDSNVQQGQAMALNSRSVGPIGLTANQPQLQVAALHSVVTDPASQSSSSPQDMNLQQQKDTSSDIEHPFAIRRRLQPQH